MVKFEEMTEGDESEKYSEARDGRYTCLKLKDDYVLMSLLRLHENCLKIKCMMIL